MPNTVFDVKYSTTDRDAKRYLVKPLYGVMECVYGKPTAFLRQTIEFKSENIQHVFKLWIRVFYYYVLLWICVD